MERLTNKREADAQREEYERRLANGYPRNIPEERFLRLAAYEDSGCEPEEVTALGKLFDYALKESKTLTEQLTLLKHIRELAEADKDGRVVVLPCKVGDTVWIVGTVRKLYSAKVRTFFCGNVSAVRGGDEDGHIQMIRTTECDIPIKKFGKAVFLTREEAEKALAEMEGKKDGV